MYVPFYVMVFEQQAEPIFEVHGSKHATKPISRLFSGFEIKYLFYTYKQQKLLGSSIPTRKQYSTSAPGLSSQQTMRSLKLNCFYSLKKVCHVMQKGRKYYTAEKTPPMQSISQLYHSQSQVQIKEELSQLDHRLRKQSYTIMNLLNI